MSLIEKTIDIHQKIKNFDAVVIDDKLSVSFDNLAYGTIIAIKVICKGYNLFGDNISVSGKEVFTVVKQNISISKNKKGNISLELPDTDIKQVEIENTFVVFDGNQVFDISNSELVTYSVEILDNDNLSNDESVISDSEKIEYLKKINPNAICIPSDHDKGWICSCGILNSSENRNCFHCGISKEKINACSESSIEQECLKLRDLRKKLEEQKKQFEIENEKKIKEEERKIEEERIKTAEESKKRIEKKNEQLRKQKLRTIFVLAALAGIIVIFTVVSIINYIVDKNTIAETIEEYKGIYVNERDINFYATIEIKDEIATYTPPHSNDTITLSFSSIDSDGGIKAFTKEDGLWGYFYPKEENGEKYFTIRKRMENKAGYEFRDYYLNGGFLAEQTHNDMVAAKKAETEYKANKVLEEKKKAEEEHERKLAEAEKKKEDLHNSDPKVGMTANEVLQTKWGTPKKKNVRESNYGTNEQWVYSGNRYVYLKDGIVTSISKSE